MNSNHAFRAFDREIDGARAWLQHRAFAACGRSATVIVDRLAQRLVEVGLCPYAAAISERLKDGRDPLPAPGARVDFGPASLEVGSGRIVVTARQWLENQREFVVHWVLCLLAILCASKRAIAHRAVLVSGVGVETLFADRRDEQFVAYCRGGPITPLRDGKRLLVQSQSPIEASSPREFIYDKRPLVTLLRAAPLGLTGRLRLAARHVGLLFGSLWAALRLPALSLLARDLAYVCVGSELDKRGCIEAIVLTCSEVANQPLWLRSLAQARVHMIWYAQNWKPIVYAADPAESEIPSLRWIRVDRHWVWTQAFADYLAALGHDPAAISVVGPIVWYLPRKSAPRADSIQIAVFDIPPYHDDIALMSGEIPNYNRPQNLLAFVDDLLAMKSQLEDVFHIPVVLRLKAKRDYNAAYDKRYFDHVEKLGAAGAITPEHHSTNIFSLISASHLVIAYPFTSPAYVAESLRVPSIYYDPTGSIIPRHFGDDSSLIRFAGSRPELLSTARSALARPAPATAPLGAHKAG